MKESQALGVYFTILLFTLITALIVLMMTTSKS